MSGKFSSAEGQQLARLLARQITLLWCGGDPEAEDLRKLFAKVVYDLLRRADISTRGSSSKILQHLLRLFREAIRVKPGMEESCGDPGELAARELASWLLGFLPEYMRNLDALINSIRARQNSQNNNKPGASAQPTGPSWTDRLDPKTRQAFLNAQFPVMAAAGAWPKLEKLAEEIQKRLKLLKPFACASVVGDLETWVAQVPLQAASSYGVAIALQTAFKGARAVLGDSSGLVKSDKDIGSVVHSNLTHIVANEMTAKFLDRYLVSEQDVYFPPTKVSIRIETVAKEMEILKEYSLTVLQTSRASLDKLYIRAAGKTSSREDLVVFYRGATATALGLMGANARPELYEIKPVDSLVSAVSQVTAYSFNYLVASCFLRCTFLPRKPGGHVDNPLMLPAWPERNSLSMPLVSISELIAVATAPGGAAGAGAIATIVEKWWARRVQTAWYVAVPFMVSGLHGIIAYILIDTKKMSGLLKTVLESILAALIAALMAYLAAKKMAEDLGEAVWAFIQAYADFLIALVIGIAMVVVLVALFGTPPGWVILGAAATAVVVLLVTGGESQNTKPGQGPENEYLSVRFGAFELRGVAAKDFGNAMTSVPGIVSAMLSLEPANDDPIPVSPPI